LKKSIGENHTLSIIASSFKDYLTRRMFERGGELMPWQRHAFGVHGYQEGLCVTRSITATLTNEPNRRMPATEGRSRKSG
jgi:hypothetical protein